MGIDSLRFCSESIPMGIMSRGGICLPVTTATAAVIIDRLHTQSSFLEIDWALIILANFSKFHTTCHIDTTGHEWFGQIVMPGRMTFADISQD